MNPYDHYKAYFEDVARRLYRLGQEPGRTNLFFISQPDDAETLLAGIRTRLVLPALLVEFPDMNLADQEGHFVEIQGAFAVVAQAERRSQGADHIEQAIYKLAKPAADAILARMQLQNDRRQLHWQGRPVLLQGPQEGNWIGPLHNDLYGWRYTFTWRIAGGICHDPSLWTP
jgi:hypothetical protein